MGSVLPRSGLRWVVGGCGLLVLLLSGAVFAAEPTAQSTNPRGHGAPADPPGQNKTKPQSPKGTPAATRARTEADPPTVTFTVDAFQTDLFTGAATAEIPIVVPPGAASIAPKIVLRYNSGVM